VQRLSRVISELSIDLARREVGPIEQDLKSDPRGVGFSFDSVLFDGSAEFIEVALISALSAELVAHASINPIKMGFARLGFMFARPSLSKGRQRADRANLCSFLFTPQLRLPADASHR
jgi:hypothetical protein